MALAANALVTLEHAKQFLGENTSANDIVIERMINSLSYTFEHETGRIIKQQTLTGYRIDGNGKYEILLPVAPVQSVTSVEIREAITDTSIATVTDTTKFTLKDAANGRLLMSENLLVLGYKNILMTMVAGYAATSVELSRFQDLLLTQLKFDYTAWQHNEIGVNARTMTDGSVAFVTRNQLLDKVQQGLDQMNIRIPMA